MKSVWKLFFLAFFFVSMSSSIALSKSECIDPSSQNNFVTVEENPFITNNQTQMSWTRIAVTGAVMITVTCIYFRSIDFLMSQLEPTWIYGLHSYVDNYDQVLGGSCICPGCVIEKIGYMATLGAFFKAMFSRPFHYVVQYAED